MIAFRKSSLMNLASKAQSDLEAIESIEQLGILEASYQGVSCC